VGYTQKKNWVHKIYTHTESPISPRWWKWQSQILRSRCRRKGRTIKLWDGERGWVFEKTHLCFTPLCIHEVRNPILIVLCDYKKGARSGQDMCIERYRQVSLSYRCPSILISLEEIPRFIWLFLDSPFSVTIVNNSLIVIEKSRFRGTKFSPFTQQVLIIWPWSEQSRA
jgi:hypothetical protein